MIALLLALATLEPGVVHESVTVPDEPAQSYALYVPRSYTPDRPSPILYFFEPRARGPVPVQRFAKAAEQFGWLVVASNNSRNGPIDIALQAANAMWRDTHRRFAIDDKRIYLGGFSGGVRVATNLALGSLPVAGVIGVGGGFPHGGDPGEKARFPFYAAAGDEDFNLAEMRLIWRGYTKRGVPVRLRVFRGTHEWLPEELAADALAWFEHKAGTAGERGDPLAACRDALSLGGSADCLKQKEVRALLSAEDREDRSQAELERRLADADPLVAHAALDEARRAAGQQRDERRRIVARRALGGTWIRLLTAPDAERRAAFTQKVVEALAATKRPPVQ